ncbi:MAG: YraN family protein [Myxococcota bacterium]|nr:YraN family protein [Myxococcota bacterium]
MRTRGETGRDAEALVAAKLASQGFAILGRNVRVGRLELDVIARRGSLLVVCEVRARSHARFAEPVASIDRAKIARVRRATAIWLTTANLRGVSVRFDAASVVFDQDPPRIEYYEEAF